MSCHPEFSPLNKSLSAADLRALISTLLVRTLGFVLLWWILSEGDLRAWWLGAAVIAIALGASLHLAPASTSPVRLTRLPGFVCYFAWQSIRGGIRVSLTALRPRPPLVPNIVELHLTLPPGGSRVLLVSALSLMPGTLGVELDGDRLRLHVLDQHQDLIGEFQGLETRIGHLLGVAP
jgi:multicomponent Na+:H+ antiporter subunit E